MPERIFPYSERTSYIGFDVEIHRPKEDKQLSSVPVLIAAGFGSNAESMQLVLHRLAERGCIAFCPDFRIGNEPRKLRFLPDVDKAKRLAILRAIQFDGYSYATGESRVDVIAHSKGAIETIMVAKDYPEHFRNIVLVAPGGIHPERNFWQAGRNLLIGDKQNSLDKTQLAMHMDEQSINLIRRSTAISREYRENNLVRMLMENWTSATQTVDQYFEKLTGNGIRIAIVAMKSDAWFPSNYLKKDKMKGDVAYHELEGIHGVMQFVPEVCDKVIDVLASMNR